MTKDRVCIVGFCETSRGYTPYDDQRYEVWGLNRGYIFMPRSDRWFDLHSPTIRGWAHRRPAGHMRWLAAYPGPVYLHETDPAIPSSVAFPLTEVADDLGEGFWRINAQLDRTSAKLQPYFDSSIAYEIGLAIHEGFKEIMVTGVDLNTAGEYVWQRSGVSYMLGLAQGRGIEVVLPDNCPLLTGPMYGRGFLSEEGEHMSDAQLDTRLKALQQEMEAAQHDLYVTQGARRELAFILEQMPPGLDHEKLEQRVTKMDQVIQQTTQRIFKCEGGLKETMYWIHQTPGGQDPQEAIAQIEMRKLDEKVNGYQANGHEQLSEGDLSVFAMINEPDLELAGVN